MRVAEVRRFGDPDVLVTAQLPDPVPGAGQVIINVVAADVIFLETQIRRGQGGEHFPVQPPYVPGGGVAGRVGVVGPGVDPSWRGRAAVARTGSGGYADQVAVPADMLIPVPETLGLLKAAALLHDGPTALGLLDNAAVRAGEHVLVTAAGGGLGLLLVQLAHAAGAHVIAAARGQAKLEAAREAGAGTVVDYSEPGWAQQVLDSTDGLGVDATFDGAGGQIGHTAFAVTAKGGRFSAHGAPGGAFTTLDPDEAQLRGVTVRGIEQVQFPPDVAKRLIERALATAASGRFTPVIGQTFSLDRAAAAHAVIENRRVVGKTLLLV